VASFDTDVSKNLIAVETLAPPPSPRVNFSICSLDKDEIFIFGGEFFNGQKTEIYGDLYSYNVVKNEWKLWKSASGPAPRSGHQALCVQTDGGQMWMFGGEFASPSQLQFYHFKDLWVFRFASKSWEKITAPNGPSARSGHRMVQTKKKLFVFGGFHDNNNTYKYFNDLYVFSMENYTWQTIVLTGTPPPARSGCCMVANTDGKIIVWGGYSKAVVKKEFDKGLNHGDMYSLLADSKTHFEFPPLPVNFKLFPSFYRK
jgi:N-acetylneuraminic acid mutarotase